MANDQIPMGAASSIPLQGNAPPVQANIPLQGDNRLPLAIKPYEAFDPIENASRMYTLADKVDSFKEKQSERLAAQTEREDTSRDKAILDRYLKGGGDLYSPEGIEKAQDALKNQVSVNTYQNLGNMLDKRKKTVQDFKQKAAELDDTQLSLYQKKYEESLKTMVGPLDVYDKTKEAKGEQEAQKAFAAAKIASLKMMAQEVNPETGQAKYSQTSLQKFAMMAPEALASEMNTTKWHRDLIKDELDSKLKTAQAKNYESQIEKRESDAELNEQKLKLMADKVAKAAGKPLAAEDRATMAEMVRMKGPEVLSRFGLSPQQRQEIISTVTELNSGQGISAREGAGAISTIKADQKSLDKLVPQLDAINAFEKTADNIGDKLIAISKKVDKTGVPVLERWVRAGKKSVEGDPDVTEFNARMQTFRTEASRIINNPNLTGVLSDSARHEMEEIIPNAASAEQIERGVNVLKSEAKTRRDYLEDQVKEVKGRIKKGAAKDDATSKGDFPSVDKDTQSDRDVAAGKLRVKEAGGVDRAKQEVADIDAAIKSAKGDAKNILMREKKIWQLGIDAEEGGGIKTASSTSSKKPTVSNW